MNRSVTKFVPSLFFSYFIFPYHKIINYFKPIINKNDQFQGSKIKKKNNNFVFSASKILDNR